MLANGIQCTTSTTGTGAIVAAQVAGYPQPGDYFTDGDVVSYGILDSGGKPLEWGIGTWVAASNSITRSIVTGTYSGSTLAKTGSPISPTSLSGTNTVIVTPIAGTFAPGRRATVSAGVAGQLVAAAPDGYCSAQGGSAAANTAYLSEYVHKTPRQVKGFRVYVGTASGNVQFALYRVNADGTIGKQVCATGTKALVAGLASYPLAAPVWLPPDSYICVVQVDNATASFRLAYGYGVTIFGPGSDGNPTAFMTSALGSFGLPTTWSGAVAPTGGSYAGPLAFVELQ